MNLRKFQNIHRLSKKFALWTILTTVLLCVALGTLSLTAYQRDILERYNQYGDTQLKISMENLDGDDVQQSIESDTMSPLLQKCQKRMDYIKMQAAMNYLYVVYFPEETKPTEMNYVLYANTQEDRDNGIPNSTINSSCGTAYSQRCVQAFYDAQFHCKDTAAAYHVINMYYGVGDSRLVLTVYRPVVNSEGKVVCIIGADIYLSQIVDYTIKYILNIILYALLSLALCLTIFFKIMQKEILGPVLDVAQSARDFVRQASETENPAELKFASVPVASDTEIRDLSQGVDDMTQKMRGYMINLRDATAEKERISTELNVATQIQADMLPRNFPNCDEFEIYATMTPAKEVGGDFYDFFMVDDTHLAMVMADVSGKGVPAALFMVIGKTLIKDHISIGCNLGDVFTKVNHLLCESNDEGLFITAFACVLDLMTGELKFVNAGHERPYIQRNGARYEEYQTDPGFILALMDGMEYTESSIQLHPEDKIYLYTDGVTESTSKDNELYGDERLADILNRNQDKLPAELLPAIKKEIDIFVGTAPQFDDITMLCMKYKAKKEDSYERTAYSGGA